MTQLDLIWDNEIKRIDALWEARDFAEGRWLLEYILKEEPGFGRAHAYMGWYLYTQLNLYKEADLHYGLAMRFDRQFPGIYYNYPSVLFELGEYSRLIDVATTGISVAGVEDDLMWNEIGRAREAADFYYSAIKAYKRAMLRSQNNDRIKYYRTNLKRVRLKRRHQLTMF